MRKGAGSRFILGLSLRETPSLLILNGLRMIAGSRGAISNDAAVMVGRPIRSRSFLFGKLVQHHCLVQRKLNIENLVELHFACPLIVGKILKTTKQPHTMARQQSFHIAVVIRKISGSNIAMLCYFLYTSSATYVVLR